MLSDTAAPEWSTPVQDTAATAPAPRSAESSSRRRLRRRHRSTNWSRCGWRRHRAHALAEPASVAPTRWRPTQWCPPGRCPCRPTKARFAASRHRGATGREPPAGDATAARDRSGPLAEESEDHAASASSEADGTRGLSSRSLPSCQHPLQPVVRCSYSMSQTLRAVRPPRCTSSASSGGGLLGRGAGGAVLDPRNSIRYFFPGDRDEAEALRASLEGQLPGGDALSVMDFSSFEPKPQEGHLEVWLRS